MRERNIKKWTAEDLNKELHVQTLGPVEHFLAKEGYSAEDLMRPIGDEQSNQVITESVKHAEIRMRHAVNYRLKAIGFKCKHISNKHEDMQ